MIKLALIGKNIQHSKSPEIYRKLLGGSVHYDLLDYENPSLIPTALELLQIYDGVSITSPYKKHFLDQVILTNQARELGAINCLRKDSQGLSGENTDFIAIMEILGRLVKRYQNLNAVILGDGVMSKIVSRALEKNKIEYKVFSRKITDDLDQLNIAQVLSEQFQNIAQGIVINTCSRNFIFKGELKKETLFWDFNYNFNPHMQSIPSKSKSYFDGMEMLELQALHALAFWSINPV